MQMTSITLTIVFSLLAGSQGFSQEPSPSPWASAFAMVEPRSGESPGDQNDPGYRMYKDGYDLILGEKWTEARKKFAELIAKYPKSEYVDDAEYWSAYALKHCDKGKAIVEYKKFIDNFPESKYYDDAVADLDDLQSSWVFVVSGDSLNYVVEKGGIRKSFNIPTPQFVPNKQMRAATRMLHYMAVAPTRRSMAMPMPRIGISGEEKLDPETKLKMDALYAIGDTKEDSTSYKALRDVALDRLQPHQLREAAMDALSDFRKFDVLPIFTEVAKTDTSEYMQNTAIEFVGQHSKDKNRSVETLMELFSSIPQYREEQLGTVLYSIADIGNDKAVDFLAKVARTNENYDLRSDAVYYLGNIGGEKARAALYEILKAK